jgi:hypothetical protein
MGRKGQRFNLPALVWLGLAAGVAVLLAPPRSAVADGAWLDNPTLTWNSAQMNVPQAPPFDPSVDPRCASQLQAASTAAGRAVEAAGWKLFVPPIVSDNVQIVRGLAGFDGMCRPMAYQAFVFLVSGAGAADGAATFVGTMAPGPMNSRTDGALNQIDLGPDNLTVVGRYARYTDQDPLCCPSALSTAVFRVPQPTPDAVLSRVSTTTEPTSAAPRPVVPAPVQVPAR